MEIKKVLYLLRIICWYQICKFTRGFSWTTSILDPGLAVGICDSVEQLQPVFLSCFCVFDVSRREAKERDAKTGGWSLRSDLSSPSLPLNYAVPPHDNNDQKKSPENCFTKNGNGICNTKLKGENFVQSMHVTMFSFIICPFNIKETFPFPSILYFYW